MRLLKTLDSKHLAKGITQKQLVLTEQLLITKLSEIKSSLVFQESQKKENAYLNKCIIVKTGLFWKKMPNRIFITKEEKYLSGINQ